VAGTTKATRRRNYRRNHLVRVASTVEQRSRGGGVERAAATVCGAVHHYTVVYVARKPMAFALIECVVSSADRRGTYGLPGKRQGTDCFPSLGGRLRYVHALAIDGALDTLEVRKRHVVMFCEDRFSHEK